MCEGGSRREALAFPPRPLLTSHIHDVLPPPPVLAFHHAQAEGDEARARFADRVERISYNALPATWASPKGGDMW